VPRVPPRPGGCRREIAVRAPLRASRRQARADVGATAGRVRDDDPHRLIGGWASGRRLSRHLRPSISFRALCAHSGRNACRLSDDGVSAQPYPIKRWDRRPNATSGLAESRAPGRREARRGARTAISRRQPPGAAEPWARRRPQVHPDGYTLLAVFDSHATNPYLFKDLPYDTLADSLRVAAGARAAGSGGQRETRTGHGRRAHQGCPSKPGAVNFATVGPAPARLLMELLRLEARIDVTMVPYKGAGSRSAISSAGRSTPCSRPVRA